MSSKIVGDSQGGKEGFMKDLDFELIFRYYLDEVYAGKPAAGLSLLEIAWIRERIDNKMLALIMRQGLEEVLLCDLELYDLLKLRRRRKCRG